MGDIRKTNSKDYIVEALIHLLKEKTFEQITVTDITREAGINRGTFYLNYFDKYDLIDQILQDIKGQLLEVLKEEDNVEDSLKKALILIKAEYRKFQSLNTSSAINLWQEIELFLEELLHKNKDFYRSAIKSHLSQIEEKYILKAFCSSITGIVIQWLNSNCEESIEKMSQVLSYIRCIYEV